MAFGRLERSDAPRPMSDINMTPLIDVMLVLLVIFLITAPLMAAHLKLDLPKVDAAAAHDAPDAVTVSLDAHGTLSMDGQPAAIADVVARVAELARRNPQAEVLLRADKAVPYGQVAELIGAVQQAGLHRIGFVAEPTHRAASAPR